MNATVRALCLAWGAVVALLAYPAGAQFLGDQRAILGGEGFYRPLTATASVTIDAMPYTRTVTASSYTLTGTSTGSGAVSWAASPSGSSGACTGTDTFSCVVTVTPDATGEGVEVITVTRGAATDTETIGFYVGGAHSVFLSQDVDGSYNSTLSDLDAVSTWENTASGLDVTQATGSAKPTFRTGIVGGQPVVRCDGGDILKAVTTADWDFLVDGTDKTIDFSWRKPDTNDGTFLSSTAGALGAAEVQMYHNGVLTSRLQYMMKDAVGSIVTTSTPTGSYSIDNFYLSQIVLDDDAGAGVDLTHYIDGNSSGTVIRSGSYPTSATGPLALCASGAGSATITADLFRVIVYQSALTATQRGINEAVDHWAMGDEWLFVGDSLTAGFGGVTSWPAKLAASAPAGTRFTNAAALGNTASQILAQWTANKSPAPAKVFVLGGVNDMAGGTSAATAYASLATIYSEAAALGVEVIAMPTLPWGNAASWSAPKQTQTLLLEDSILADGNVDVFVSFYDLMGEPGTPEDLAAIYDNGDGVHPNDAGTTVMADEVAAALGL